MQFLFIVCIALITFFRSTLFVISDIADKAFITTETFGELKVNSIVFFLGEAIAIIFM